jgi:hypothetical protein
MHSRFGLVAAVAAIATFALLPGMVAGQTADPIDRAALFIASAQQPDGGFGGFGDGQTFDAVFALRAAGINPADVKNSGKSPADFLIARADAQDTAGEAAKAALAAAALSLDPENAGGVNLIERVESALDGATGRFAGDDFNHGLAVIGLACTQNEVPAAAVEALRESQLEDGGWGFDGASDPDTSSVGLQALLAAGVDVDDPDVVEALEYFRATQGNDGGWGFSPDESNASSTAFVLQGLIEAGEPVDGATYEKGGVTPREYLLAQQQADGSFAGFDPAYAAMQAVPALAGRSLCDAPSTPVTKPPPVVATPAPSPSPTATTTAPAPAPPQTGTGMRDGGGLPWLALSGAVVALAALVAGGMARRRR